MDIKPGLGVRIVTEANATDRSVVRSSVIYEMTEQTAFLAQTDPPVLKSVLPRDVTVTYLVRRNEVMVRYGFPARIAGITDYRLNSGQAVKALVVDVMGEARPHNIRGTFRVAPTGKSGLSMTIRRMTVNVLNISLGGAKVSYDKSLDLRPGSKETVAISMGGESHPVQARILDTWSGAGEGFPRHLRFATMEFLEMSKGVENALSQKIRAVERESRQGEPSR